MAELVTGHANKAHATAEQAAGLNAGILGLDDYVLDVHDKFKITVVSANKVTIGTGELVMQGRRQPRHARGPDRHQRLAGSETQRPRSYAAMRRACSRAGERNRSGQGHAHHGHAPPTPP